MNSHQIIKTSVLTILMLFHLSSAQSSQNSSVVDNYIQNSKPLATKGDVTEDKNIHSKSYDLNLGSTYPVQLDVVGLLSGNTLVLQNNGGDDLSIDSDGSYQFPIHLVNGSTFEVTVLTQPNGTPQFCSVDNFGQTVINGAPGYVFVTCEILYPVEADVFGLSPGNTLVLQNNGGDDLSIDSDGSYQFPTYLLDGSTFEVTVLTQPSNTPQLCTVDDFGASVISGAPGIVIVNCEILYPVEADVFGLSPGNTLALQNNGGDDLSIDSDGFYEFPTYLLDGSTFEVTVLTQPSNTPQLCTVDDFGASVISGAPGVVIVTCEIMYPVEADVFGLSPGNTLVLQNNGGDDLSIDSDGFYEFPTYLLDGSTYEVTVLTQPSNTPQLCTVNDFGASVISGAPGIVIVNCENLYPVHIDVTGLYSGNTVVLQNNGGDDISINNNGIYEFPTYLLSGSTYEVTVLTQPSNTPQLCIVDNFGETVIADGPAIVQVTCENLYPVHIDVTGLYSGNTVILQNNGGDDLNIHANGSYLFSNSLVDGADYLVTVATNPTTPNQTCTVKNGLGVIMGGAPIVAVDCVINSYFIAGMVEGLLPGNFMILQNNGGDDLVIAESGSFVFDTPIEDFQDYDVTIETTPVNPIQPCSIYEGQGSVNGNDVLNIEVVCEIGIDLLYHNGFE